MASISPRPEPSPQLSTSPHADDSPALGSRSRSRSRRFLDSISDHLGRNSSPSPENAGLGLAQAGLILGSTGSEHLINRSIQEIRDGAEAFLHELERVVSSARIESHNGVRRVNTDLVQGTIQLQDIVESDEDFHSITDAEENPFEPSAEPATPSSPVDSAKINDYFIEDIQVPFHEHDKLFMRARLDSGMEDNAISEEKARETGFEVEPYTGPDIIVGNGQTFRPVGFIELQFHFERVQSAKTWKVRFLIFPDPPFDVAFGRNFIYKAKLFQRPAEALPMEYRRLTPQQEAEMRARTAHRDQYSSSRQSYNDSQYSSRRKPADSSKSSTHSSSRSSYRRY